MSSGQQSRLNLNKFFLDKSRKELALGEVKGSASAWIFMMKNLHGWKDRNVSNNEADHQPLKIEIVGV